MLEPLESCLQLDCFQSAKLILHNFHRLNTSHAALKSLLIENMLDVAPGDMVSRPGDIFTQSSLPFWPFWPGTLADRLCLFASGPGHPNLRRLRRLRVDQSSSASSNYRDAGEASEDVGRWGAMGGRSGCRESLVVTY